MRDGQARDARYSHDRGRLGEQIVPRRTATPYCPPPADSITETYVGRVLPAGRAFDYSQQRWLGQLMVGADGPKLWCAGDLSLLQRPCVAVVGTREVSPDGARRARRLGRELAQAGVVVVSGLARGVDTEALSAAIEAGGKVVAVIGTPLAMATPAPNRPLQELIYREHLLVSQFAPGSQVYPTNFPARNRVMAAISDATAIVEASDTSGALHQASECVHLGRWLFICKALTETPGVTWPEKFLTEPRARILTDTRQILEVLATSS